ncbi:g4294 [Coccomyxa elongata]
MLPLKDVALQASQRAEHHLKEELVNLYYLRAEVPQGKEIYVRCQATGEVLLSDAVVAGHLFPAESADFGAEWGLADPANDVRNVLVWYEGVHMAWRDLRICLEYVGNVLRLRVLDRTLLDVCPVDLAAPHNRELASDALRAMTFQDLDK